MATNSDKKKVGRPSIYSQGLADNICEQIATSSKSMRTICREMDLSISTVINWLTPGNLRYIEDFERQYARAKEMQAEYLAEELIDIADDGRNDTYTDDEGRVRTDYDVIARSKLRVDARKWIASKLKPKKYGDKLDVTSLGDKVTPIVWQETKTYDSNSEANDRP